MKIILTELNLLQLYVQKSVFTLGPLGTVPVYGALAKSVNHAQVPCSMFGMGTCKSPVFTLMPISHCALVRCSGMKCERHLVLCPSTVVNFRHGYLQTSVLNLMPISHCARVRCCSTKCERHVGIVPEYCAQFSAWVPATICVHIGVL